jgi:hypothetical protein
MVKQLGQLSKRNYRIRLEEISIIEYSSQLNKFNFSFEKLRG